MFRFERGGKELWAHFSFQAFQLHGLISTAPLTSMFEIFHLCKNALKKSIDRNQARCFYRNHITKAARSALLSGWRSRKADKATAVVRRCRKVTGLFAERQPDYLLSSNNQEVCYGFHGEIFSSARVHCFLFGFSPAFFHQSPSFSS
jgi:hypothetical protein